MENREKLLDVKNLNVSFHTYAGEVKAVRGLDFHLYPGETLAFVGESGCGKSVTAKSLMRLLPKDSSEIKKESQIIFNGKNVLAMNSKELTDLRGNDISMIFQDPMTSLNPTMRIGDQIKEALKIHRHLSGSEADKVATDLLELVQIPEAKNRLKAYPHELSGGMRQRVIIAIALACKPKIIIADEPTTALDVTIQAQILDLLVSIQKEINAGIILITHDLGVVAQLADRVCVMYAGQIVEQAPVLELFTNPKHPYTRSLLNSIPQMDADDEDLYVIQGMVPSLKNLPRQGCRFKARIPWIKDEEHEENPTMHEVAPGHFVRCTCYKNFHFNEKGDN